MRNIVRQGSDHRRCERRSVHRARLQRRPVVAAHHRSCSRRIRNHSKSDSDRSGHPHCGESGALIGDDSGSSTRRRSALARRSDSALHLGQRRRRDSSRRTAARKRADRVAEGQQNRREYRPLLFPRLSKLRRGHASLGGLLPRRDSLPADQRQRASGSATRERIRAGHPRGEDNGGRSDA